MEGTKKHIVVVAGEASGDMHAAHLVDALKSQNPQLTFSGVGGPKMAASGVELYQDLTKIAVIGFFEVLKHYGEFKKCFNMVLQKIKDTKADAVILVDYPGFNLRLAKALHNVDVKVIYYISPQLWAWKENRVHDIKKYVDQMLVLFPFEEEFYAKYDMKATCVGHPLIDQIGADTQTLDLNTVGLDSNKTTIGLLPGSRKKEIDTLLPVMLESAKILYQQNSDLQFLVVKASTIAQESIKQLTQNYDLPLAVVDNQMYASVRACDFCLVTSGTATLETAILQKPMVVIYKTSFLTWLLAKTFVKIPNIGLVNVVAGERVVPECIQYDATPANIANACTNILTDKDKLTQIQTKLQTVKTSLGHPGASTRAAQIIVNNSDGHF